MKKSEVEGVMLISNPSSSTDVDLLRRKSVVAFDQTEINNSSNALDVGPSVNNEKEGVESFNQRC